MHPAATDSMSFPAPSAYMVDTSLNLNQLVKSSPTTFFFKVSGDDMAAGCHHCGDLFLVDLALDPVQGWLVIVFVWQRRQNGR